ncbi:MAG: acyl-CoA/acyl-ACP dehydrogenase [Chloroflexi bacterium]|nr:acyl-CoA/acyl-ACP dehydrogenase [Chloroflexota bacterium]
MDLGLSEEQEMIKKSARDFLDKECPKSLVRAMEEDNKGFSPDVWKKMADLGWMALPFSDKYGGTGNSFLDLCVLIEEHGRALLPGPFFSTVVLCGMPIQQFGSDDQKKKHLSRIANGQEIWIYAQTEPSATWEASGVELKATAQGSDYVLDGTKLFIPYGGTADYLLVVARTKAGKGEDGISLFIVDAKAQGIKYEALKTIASDHQVEITFKGVKVPKANLVGKENQGWAIVKKIDELGAAGKCAEMVGGAQKVLEMSVDYAKQRVQFGRPIGSFQAIQHHCANMVTDVDGSRYIAYEAIWRASEGLDASKEVSMAKAWVSDAYRRVCALGHQIHGGIGFTKEHDMQLYFRRAKAAELAFGDADFHRELVAQQLGI